MEFSKTNMANPDQKTILIEQACSDINKICIKFQEDTGSSKSEISHLLKELSSLWETEEKIKFGFQ